MTKVIKELSSWLVVEFYNDNLKTARKIVRVLDKNGYNVDYDKLKTVKNYKLNDVIEYYRAADILKERK